VEIDLCPRWALAKVGVPYEVRPHVGLLLSSMAAMISPLLLIHLPHVCLMQRFLHIPCPGCGVLHAMTSLLRLHFVEALQFNPAGVVLASLLCLQIVARPIAIVSARTRPAINKLSKRGSTAALAALISVWILRLLSGGFTLGSNLLSQMQHTH
jgi:hypothetical protein